jgi:hypothetical protein
MAFMGHPTGFSDKIHCTDQDEAEAVDCFTQKQP